jgi:hypothetical protein
MKNTGYFGMLFLLLGMLTSSCNVIGDIFQAGVWVGILGIVVIVVIIFVIKRLLGK